MTIRGQLMTKNLARASALGGHEVFEILVRDHSAMLLSFLRSLLRAADLVDDLFQETMLTAWRRLPDYDRERPFGPWLRGIAVRLVLKHRERHARGAVTCEPEVLEALELRYRAAAASPETFAAVAERLQQCLQSLPQKLRDVIGFVYEQGMRLCDAARAIEVSEEAAKKRVQRGRQQLAECLRRNGVVA
ncbi:MAG TPA: RNA polymerase sigma factor [Planctomycetota bacterium]